jgi:hypothetical protein
MTARKHVTEDWDDVTFDSANQSPIEQKVVLSADFKFRHWLFFVSIFLAALTPITWLTQSLNSALLCGGLAGLSYGISVLLVPSQVYRIDDDDK